MASKYLMTAVALAMSSAAAPGSAAIVGLRLQGTVPTSGVSVQGQPGGTYTPFQQLFFGSYFNFGASYDFTFSYDTAAVATGGNYPLTLVSGQLGSLSNFSDFVPRIYLAPQSGFAVVHFELRKTEAGGTSIVTLTLADNDGSLPFNGLPSSINQASYDQVNLEFRNDAINGLRYAFFAPSPGSLTEVRVTTGVPEPATWAMMIGGFGLIGASLRRRQMKVAFVG